VKQSGDLHSASELQKKEPLLSQLAVENCQRPLSRQVVIWIVPSVNPAGNSKSSKQNDFCLLSNFIKQKKFNCQISTLLDAGRFNLRGDTCGYHLPEDVTVLSAVSHFPWGIRGLALSCCS